MAKEISDSEFEQVISENKLVLVDFWAPWCGPCRMIAPAVDEISQEYEGKVLVCKMNIDQNKDTPAKFGIMSIPNLLLFKDGKMVDSVLGAVPKERIAGMLDKNL